MTARLFKNEFVFEDATGRFLLHLDPGQAPCVGDIVDITGYVSKDPYYRHDVWSKTLSVVGHTNVPAVAERPLSSLHGRDCQALPVLTSGFVEEAFRDEVDPRWIILLLRDGSASIPVSLRDNRTCSDFAARLFGRRVRIRGVCLYNIKGERRYTGLRLVVSQPSDIVPNWQKTNEKPPHRRSTSSRPIRRASSHKVGGRPSERQSPPGAATASR